MGDFNALSLLANGLAELGGPSPGWDGGRTRRTPGARHGVALPSPRLHAVRLHDAGPVLDDESLCAQLRGIFRLVDQFLLLCRLDSERYRLEGLVQDLLVELRDCLVAASTRDDGVAALPVEHERCVRELEDFLQTLRLGMPLSCLELTHALDGVIVHCVVLDAQRRDAEMASAGLPADLER